MAKYLIPYAAGISIEQKETYPFADDVPEGRWAVYEIQLLNRPTDTVTLRLTIITPTITLSQYQLIFQPDNWNTVQDITVFAVDDDVNRRSPYIGSFSIKSISSDKNYDDVPIEDFILTIEDNDEGKIIIIVTDISNIFTQMVQYWLECSHGLVILQVVALQYSLH